MTVGGLLYRAGQTYTLTQRPTDDIIEMSEVGAIFQFPEGGQTRNRIVALREGTVNQKTTLVYYPIVATATTISEPPNRAAIDSYATGTILRYVKDEIIRLTTFYYIVVEINNKKYITPLNQETGIPSVYRTDETYPIAAYPHVSLVEPNTILEWGRQKIIAVQRAGTIIYEDYEEDISWPLNTVWAAPASEDPEIQINWDELLDWSPFNTDDWISTGKPFTNFGGHIGWLLTVRVRGRTLTAFTPEDRRPRWQGDKVILPVPALADKVTYTFAFNTPVRIVSFNLNITSPDRTGIISSGPYELRNIRNPRYPKAEWSAPALIGVNTVPIISSGQQGWIEGPVSAPFPPVTISATSLMDEFTIEVDNSLYFFDSFIEISELRVQHVNIGTRYRIDYDLDTGDYIGRDLSGGPTVVLSTQNVEEGWTQTEDSVFDMEVEPNLKWGRTEGFYKAESFWSSENNVFWRCENDEQFNANWIFQKVAALAHPFHNILLQAYDPNYLANLPFAYENQGLFLSYYNKVTNNNTAAFTFKENQTSIRYLNDQLENQGYAVPQIGLIRNVSGGLGRNNISINAGSYNSPVLSSTLFGQLPSAYQIPGCNIDIVAGNGFYNAPGGGLTFTAGAGVGRGQPNGSIRFLLQEPRDASLNGFAVRPGVDAEALSDPGYFEFGVQVGDIPHITRLPLTHPEIGQTIRVTRYNDRIIGTGVTERRAETEWVDFEDAIPKQIIRSALPPTTSTEKPTWEFWYQETTRALYQFTHAKVGSVYRPIPIPWCCAPVKEYELLKPNAIDRSSDAPTVSSDPPSWEIWIQEGATEIKRFTWGQVGNQYRPVEIPWISTYDTGTNQLVPETVLVKPAAGTFDDREPTIDEQIVRSNQPPSALVGRPAWDFWVQEAGYELRLFTHAKTGDDYRLIPIPWATVYNTAIGVFEPDLVLRKTGPAATGRPQSSTVASIVERSPDAPEITSLRPNWQFWIQETSTSLRWFTWGSVFTRFIPIQLPWSISYDANTGLITQELEAIKA